MKKTAPRVMAIIVLIWLAGCGGADNAVDIPNAVSILSDQFFDGDISRDAATGSLGAPTYADEVQNVIAGIVFDPLTDAEISESRGFLNFSLSGTGVPGDPARITFATISVFVNSVEPAPADSLAEIPFLIDLINTDLFPPPVVSTDFSVPPSLVRTTFFRGADAGSFVEIDITTLLREAIALGMTDFEVRFRFDRARYQADLDTIRGLVEIDDADDTPEHRRIIYAPLLSVVYF